MANIIKIAEQNDDLRKTLTKLFQSGNINILLGSGASYPAIPTAGNVERDIQDLYKNNRNEDAIEKTYEFLLSIQTPNNAITEGYGPKEKLEDESEESFASRLRLIEALDQTSKNYLELMGLIEKALIERKTQILGSVNNFVF